MELLKPISHTHFKLYKPYGVLSQFDSNAKHQRNNQFLGQFFEFPEGTMPIGRLDQDSEGLLLLTTDGKVSYSICKGTFEKEYYVQVDGAITKDAICRLQAGVEISHRSISYVTKPCKAHVLDTIPNFPERGKKIRSDRHGPTSWISICITEGKFRQVRKMTAVVGFPTLRLVRVRIGEHYLDDMALGQVIKMETLV